MIAKIDGAKEGRIDGQTSDSQLSEVNGESLIRRQDSRQGQSDAQRGNRQSR